MGVDEAGQHEAAAEVEDLGAGAGEGLDLGGRAHGHDMTPADCHGLVPRARGVGGVHDRVGEDQVRGESAVRRTSCLRVR